MIFDIIGSPSARECLQIEDQTTRDFLRTLPTRDKVDLKSAAFFPGADPRAIDLLTKLLAFLPHERLTVQQALEHPFLQDVREKDPQERAKYERRNRHDWEQDSGGDSGDGKREGRGRNKARKENQSRSAGTHASSPTHQPLVMMPSSSPSSSSSSSSSSFTPWVMPPGYFAFENQHNLDINEIRRLILLS